MISYNVTPVPDTPITFIDSIGVKKMLIYCDTGAVTLKALPDNLVVSTAPLELEFPKLGKSLPACITPISVQSATQLQILLEELDGIPDTRYFEIESLDEDGMPVYANTADET